MCLPCIQSQKREEIKCVKCDEADGVFVMIQDVRDDRVVESYCHYIWSQLGDCSELNTSAADFYYYHPNQANGENPTLWSTCNVVDLAPKFRLKCGVHYMHYTWFAKGSNFSLPKPECTICPAQTSTKRPSRRKTVDFKKHKSQAILIEAMKEVLAWDSVGVLTGDFNTFLSEEADEAPFKEYDDLKVSSKMQSGELILNVSIPVPKTTLQNPNGDSSSQMEVEEIPIENLDSKESPPKSPKLPDSSLNFRNLPPWMDVRNAPADFLTEQERVDYMGEVVQQPDITMENAENPEVAENATPVEPPPTRPPVPVENFQAHENNLMTSLQYWIQYRVMGQYYFSITQVIQDLYVVIDSYISRSVAAGKHSLVKYLQTFLSHAIPVLLSNRDLFKTNLQKDLEDHKRTAELLCLHVNWEQWNTQPYRTRKYHTLDQFVPYKEDGFVTKKIMTQIQGECSGEHCDDLDKLGPLNLILNTWQTECQDRTNKAECSEACACDPEKCQNRAIAQGKRKKLGEDIVETPSWGIDPFTACTICQFLRKQCEDAERKHFVSKIMPKAFHTTEAGFDIIQVLHTILTNDNKMFTLRHQKLAAGLLNAVNGIRELSEEYGNKWFRIHPKGTGVICRAPEGIKKNSLIVEYFGEYYSPYQWFEKQDAIKSLQNSGSVSKELVNFYNIMLERHLYDPDGYDILIVDPILKGSFGSRLSHSCDPNCATVATATEGQYKIGMYAIRPIELGDELTFDYCSTTESPQENREAVCLCGQAECRQSYLLLSKDNSVNEFIAQYHTFLHRISIILTACTNPELTEEDEERLKLYSFGNCMLDGAPQWLKKWIALIAGVIQEELKPYIELGKKLDEVLIKDSRMQNLAITVDKIKYCLRMQHGDMQETPALILANDEEVAEFLWGKQNSIRESLKILFKKQQLPEKHSELLAILRREVTEDRQVAEANIKDVCDLLRETQRNILGVRGVADVLDLYLKTKVFFHQTNYEKVVSKDIQIRHCDISAGETPKEQCNTDISAEQLGTSKFTRTKAYSNSYVIGSLVHWFKQTVEKPDASYAADKRGVLTLPSFNFDEEAFHTIYNDATQRKWFNDLKNTKVDKKGPWKLHSNKGKICGTPMLDAIHLKDENLLKEVLKLQ